MAMRMLLVAASLSLAFVSSPAVEEAQAACLIPPSGGSCPIPACTAGATVTASAIGQGTVSAECGGGSCSDTDDVNPGCSFTVAFTDTDGTCGWAGVGYAHCNWA